MLILHLATTHINKRSKTGEIITKMEQTLVWQKDSARKTCNDCNLLFTIRRRRHHCRRCGLLFCKKCSGEKYRLDTYMSPFGKVKNSKDEKLRVCDRCFIAIVKSDENREFNTRARRRSATLEKAQEFLNNPTPQTYTFSVNDNDFSQLHNTATTDDSLNFSFASSSELLHDDSDDERDFQVATSGSFVDEEEASENVSEVEKISDSVLSNSLSQLCNIDKPTKRTVKSISKYLLEQQKSQLRSNEILLENNISELKKEIAQLEKLIHRKQGKGRTSRSNSGNGNASFGNRSNAEQEDDREEIHAATEANILRYAVLNDKLINEQIEQKFPESMRWVLRMQPEQNFFLGIRDIDIENLKATFDIKGKHGKIKLHVTILESAFSVYELKICGSTQSAKMYSNLLSPSRIDLKVYGEWLMPLIFSAANCRWEVSKDAIFKLKVKKNVGGVSAIKLPDKLVSWLLNKFLPNVIKDAIISSLPVKLGDLIHDEMTTINLYGSINIKSDLPINLWQAKLHKDTSLGRFARSKLGITKDEAERLYYTFRHAAGRAAGFGTKVSMRGLHKFRLKYASCSDDEVAVLLDTIDRVANPTLGSRGWFNEIMRKVDRLSLKSQTVNISISNANILFDLYTLVHTIVDIEMEALEADVKTQEGHMLHDEKKNKKRDGKAERRHSGVRISDAVSRARNSLALAKAASKFTFTAIDVAISIIEKTSMELKCLVRGGADGLALLSLDDLSIAFHLLSFFEIIFPEQVVQFMRMAMIGTNGPGKDEYKFSYYPIYGDKRVLTPVQLILGHTKLEFLSGLLTGFSKRLCLQFRSELFNELMDISNKNDSIDQVDDHNSNNNKNINSNGTSFDEIEAATDVGSNRGKEESSKEDAQNILAYLIPYFLNDDHDLLLQTHGLSLEFARVDGYKLGMALKPISQTMTNMKKDTTDNFNNADSNNMISFQITMNLSQLFKSI
eukprot:g9601.t1